MIHLTKQFLQTDTSKLISFQTVKTNFGFASSGKNEAKATTEIVNVRTSTLDIIFPLTASCIALLIETAPTAENEIDETIINAKIAPPGTNSVRFTLSGDNEYWVYILGKDLVNGYISTDGAVVSEYDTVSKRLVFTVNSAQQVEPRLELSTPSTQQTWYNYDSYYTGPLIWHPPVGTDDQGIPKGQYTYLIYFRDMLSDILDVFTEQAQRPNELTIRTADDLDVTRISDQIRILGARSKIDRFLRQLLLDHNYNDENIKEYITYVLNRTNENDADNNIHELVEPYIVNDIFGLIGTTTHSNFNSSNQAKISYYDAVRNRLRDIDFTNIYERVYEDTNKVFYTMVGETRLASTSSGVFGSPDALKADVDARNTNFKSALIELDWVSSQAFSYEAVIAKLNDISIDFYNNVYTFTKQKLIEVDELIKQAGDIVFVSGGTSGDTGSSIVRLAQEGILQNIRYLKQLINESTTDIWASTVNLDSLIIKTLGKVLSNTQSTDEKTNSIFNIAASFVNPEEVEIFYSKNDQYNIWTKYNGQIITTTDNVKIFDISFLTGAGNYTFLIRPQKIRIGITDVVGENVISTPDLNDFQTENYFYGWNIEFSQAGQQGQRLGDIRVITSSYFTINDHRLKISPSIDGVIDFTKNINADIWSNSFIPILVNVEITEHNFSTLSYGQYASKEFDTTTGVLTLFDYNGNVYKRWTIGERTLQEEGYHRIEFRYPIISGT